MLFLEHELPEVAAAARWYLEPVDYLSMRFTGVAAASAASMAGAWLTDNRRPDPAPLRPGADPGVRGPRGEAAPAASRPAAWSGRYCPEVADDLGLAPGVAVVAGTPDLHSAAAGAGAVLAYQPHLAISTTSWLSCPFPGKKTDPIRQMATVPGILPGLNLVANNQDSGGGALAWLQRLPAPTEEPSTPTTS